MGPSKVYVRGSDSGRKIECHFCPDCGSTVFWYAEIVPDLIDIAFGAFADPSMPWPTVSVWERTRHPWVSFGLRLKRIRPKAAIEPYFARSRLPPHSRSYLKDSQMTTIIDKQRSATSNVQSSDEAASDQVLSRIAALAPMIAQLAPDIEQGRRLPAELVSALRSARIGLVIIA
jgi:hypothetical protein